MWQRVYQKLHFSLHKVKSKNLMMNIIVKSILRERKVRVGFSLPLMDSLWKRKMHYLLMCFFFLHSFWVHSMWVMWLCVAATTVRTLKWVLQAYKEVIYVILAIFVFYLQMGLTFFLGITREAFNEPFPFLVCIFQAYNLFVNQRINMY